MRESNENENAARTSLAAREKQLVLSILRLHREGASERAILALAEELREVRRKLRETR